MLREEIDMLGENKEKSTDYAEKAPIKAGIR
jgi:hypothetical protein